MKKRIIKIVSSLLVCISAFFIVVSARDSVFDGFPITNSSVWDLSSPTIVGNPDAFVITWYPSTKGFQMYSRVSGVGNSVFWRVRFRNTVQLEGGIAYEFVSWFDWIYFYQGLHMITRTIFDGQTQIIDDLVFNGTTGNEERSFIFTPAVSGSYSFDILFYDSGNPFGINNFAILAGSYVDFWGVDLYRRLDYVPPATTENSKKVEDQFQAGEDALEDFVGRPIPKPDLTIDPLLVPVVGYWFQSAGLFFTRNERFISVLTIGLGLWVISVITGLRLRGSVSRDSNVSKSKKQKGADDG